jgi:hypothetical protein
MEGVEGRKRSACGRVTTSTRLSNFWHFSRFERVSRVACEGLRFFFALKDWPYRGGGWRNSSWA